MINYNGTIVNDDYQIATLNRGYKYGDGLFETIKVVSNTILFWEDHYFRVMASMRILRMEIPMSFTMEFLEDEILKLINELNLQEQSVKINLYIHRNSEGLYTPDDHDVDYIIKASKLNSTPYLITQKNYVVDLFKEYYVNNNLLSTLKTNNKITNVLGSIYAKENDMDNYLLLNVNKQVAESLNGNIFLVKDNVIKTPPLSDGCLNGIMRKQIIKLIQEAPDFTLLEASISPFDLQKADELFITNVIQGITPITTYRKKQFETNVSNQLLKSVNEVVANFKKE